MKQVADRRPEGRREPGKTVESEVRLAGLDCLDVARVEAGRFSERFLRHATSQAQFGDPATHGVAKRLLVDRLHALRRASDYNPQPRQYTIVS
jgi:hypothetical protein